MFIISIAMLTSGCAVVLCVRCSSAPNVALRHWYTGTLAPTNQTARCCNDIPSFQLTDSLKPQLGHTFGSQLFLVYGGLRLFGNEG